MGDDPLDLMMVDAPPMVDDSPDRPMPDPMMIYPMVDDPPDRRSSDPMMVDGRCPRWWMPPDRRSPIATPPDSPIARSPIVRSLVMVDAPMVDDLPDRRSSDRR